jgi:hypothetical protein
MDKVWVVRTGRFEKFPEMIFGRSSLALEVAFDSRYALLTGVISFLITDKYGDMTRSLLLPLLATLSTFPGALGGGLGGYGLIIVSAHFRVA